MFTRRVRASKFLVTCALLGVGCTLLALMLVLQGPRIRQVELDTKKLAGLPGQRIILRANQPVLPLDKSAITLSPSAKFSVTTAGDAVVIQMNEQLRYHTEYRLSVANLKARRTNKTTDFTYAFKTADASLYYIKRHYGTDDTKPSKPPDQIVHRQLGGNQSEKVVFEAERIKAFVLLEDDLIVSTTRNNVDTLLRVSRSTDTSTSIPLAAGMVTELHASPNRQDFGYIFTPKDTYTTSLFIYDSKAKASFSVNGFDNKPLTATYWQYAPDAQAAVVQVAGIGALLIDTTQKNKPVPLGNYNQLFGFSKDGSKLLVSDNDGLLSINTQTGTRTLLKPTVLDGITTYPYMGLFLTNLGNDATLQHTFTYEAEGTISHIFVKSGSAVKEIYAKRLDTGNVVDLGASPNGQYAAIETSSKGSTYDQYPGATKPRNIYTEIIDTSSGARARGVDGFGIIWD